MSSIPGQSAHSPSTNKSVRETPCAELHLPNDRPPKKDSDLHFEINTVVEQLAGVIRGCNPPFHIALFSPWGSGKSTVLEQLPQALASKPIRCVRCGQVIGHEPKVRVARVDAWKYRHDSMRRRLLLKAASKVDPASVADLERQMYKPISGVAVMFDIDWPQLLRGHGWGRMGQAILARFADVTIYLSMIVAVTAAITYLKNLEPVSPTAPATSFWQQWATTVTSSGAASVGAMTVVAYILTVLGRQYVRRGHQAEMAGVEQFEDRFHAALKKLPKGERLLVVIDELDRCSPEQVREVLETVRTFMDEDRCVFLVACDRSVLEHALAQQAEALGRSVPLYLEKFFELTVTLPALLQPNVVKYAWKVLEDAAGPEEAAKIVASGALDQLIWSEVCTPRKVKRLVNDFLVRRNLALSRHMDLSQDLRLLAKLTVLMQDFSKFAQELFIEPDLMNWMEAVRTGRVKELSPHARQVCGAWYQKDQQDQPDFLHPLCDAASLITYLGETRDCLPDSSAIRSLQYLSNDPVPVETGLLRKIQALAGSGQHDLLKEAVGLSGAHDEILRHLVDLLRGARGVRRENLELSLLHLSKYAIPGKPGAKAAAAVIAQAARSITFELDGLTPVAVVPYLSDMPDDLARETWAERICEWVEDDLTTANDSGPIGHVFAPGTLELLPWGSPGAAGRFRRLLWKWLAACKVNESTKWWGYLLAVEPVEQELYAGLSTHVGDFGDRKLAVRLYLDLAQRVGPDDLFTLFQKFPVLLATLVDISEPNDLGPVLDHVCAHAFRHPIQDIGGLVLRIAKRSGGYPSTQVSGLLKTLRDQIIRHNLFANAWWKELISLIALPMHTPEYFEPMWQFVTSFWPKLGDGARQAFHIEVLRRPKLHLTTAQLKREAVWLRRHSNEIPDADRVHLYHRLAEAPSADAAYRVLSVFLDPAPFDISDGEPKQKLLQAIVDMACVVAEDAPRHPEDDAARLGLFNLLLRNPAGLPLDSMADLNGRIQSSYLIREAPSDVFEQAVKALVSWAGSLPMATQEQRHQLMPLTGTVIARKSELADPQLWDQFDQVILAPIIKLEPTLSDDSPET